MPKGQGGSGKGTQLTLNGAESLLTIVPRNTGTSTPDVTNLRGCTVTRAGLGADRALALERVEGLEQIRSMSTAYICFQ